MSGPRSRASLAAATLALAALAAPAPARASGLDSPAQIGTGQSGPVSRDAAAVHWNPAQLAFLARPELLVGAGFVAGEIRYQRERRGTYQTPDSLDFRRPTSLWKCRYITSRPSSSKACPSRQVNCQSRSLASNAF